MVSKTPNAALKLVDDFVAAGKVCFTFDEAVRHLGRSPSATANLLRRMVSAGLIDRVRRGRYVVRNLGVLGTRAAAEEVALAVAAAFKGQPHRIGYRTALDEHDLISHPVRTIQVAATSRMRVRELSGRPLRTIREPEAAISTGTMAHGPSWISNLERALLDAAARPELVGGATVLAEAISTAGVHADSGRLWQYAEQLGWAAALRRIGSVADTLDIEGLAGKLRPLEKPQADLDLEPAPNVTSVWRDSRWRVRWGQSRDELANVARQ
ncbi:MAG: type IV toxin-antitoxin system AbiEi family antitoxin domain-containing protein [Acidobacteriota bacterium]